jgi:RHS repeat-associated protein
MSGQELYMQQRYYEPLAGRFLSVDPVVTNANTGAMFNRYDYAMNNPYKYVDPDGMACTGTNIQSQSCDGGGIVGHASGSVTRYAPEPGQASSIAGGSGLKASGGTASSSLGSLLPGTAAGDRAAQYWANKQIETGNGLYAIPGLFASLWTPDTAVATTFTLVTAGVGGAGFRLGREISFGKDFRIALFGNRTGHPLGQFPHYHRRGVDSATGQTTAGQGIGRHRPWETKSTDKSFWDRF